MRKYLIVAMTIVLVFGAFVAATPAAAQETDPAGVVEAIYAEIEDQDVDAAVALLAEDAVLTLVPPPAGLDGTFIGKEEIGEWFEGLAVDNGRFEFSNISVNGNTATMKLLSYSGFFDSLGISPAEFDGVAVVQDGLLKSLSFVFTPEFGAKMGAAMGLAANETAATRYFKELWNQGDLSVADEIVAEDFVSHSYPFPDGDREAMKESVAGFRAGNPNAYFTLDDVVVTADKVFVTSTMMVRPEGAAADAEGEPAGEPMMVVLGMKDGKITDRWRYVTPE